ncbi:MAG TPA: hypothetical protein VNQ90_20925 [Chthoniobacteraceae bacterium]|nr:hypothetical protein [Chthoniobacteraceae bacterium]
MKKTILLTVLLCCAGASAPVHAQGNAAVQIELDQARTTHAAAGTGQSVEQILTELKAANAALLEKQKATLQRLEQLEKQAEQLRIFSKRS